MALKRDIAGYRKSRVRGLGRPREKRENAAPYNLADSSLSLRNRSHNQFVQTLLHGDEIDRIHIFRRFKESRELYKEQRSAFRFVYRHLCGSRLYSCVVLLLTSVQHPHTS